MKKVFKTTLAIILVFTLLCGCREGKSHVTNYDVGFYDGYEEGKAYAQKQLASQIEVLYHEIYGFSENYPMGMEDVEAILFCYADCNEKFTEEEIKEAILIALEYKDNVNDLIYDIDEMEIY